MAALYAQLVDHSTVYKRPQFTELYDFKTKEKIRDLTDDDKDIVYHKVEASDVTGNYKRFVIEEPVLQNQMGKYLFQLGLNEMNWEHFNNIEYKKTTNAEFHDRLKQFPTKTFRYYYKNAWITYYFNQSSKSRVVEEDAMSNIIIHSCYPPHFIGMYLESPCMAKSPPSMVLCDIPTYWAQAHTIDLEWKFGSCFEVIKNKLTSDDFFYTKPGENDYLIECYTIDYDRDTDASLRPTEYYILDRDGYYFKSGKHDFEIIKDKVLKTHNESCEERHSMEATEKWVSPYPDHPTPTMRVRSGSDFKLMLKEGKFEAFELLYANMIREIIARYNSFKEQWNTLIELFNASENKDGWYCSTKDPGVIPKSPEEFSLKDSKYLNAHDRQLIQKLFSVKTYDLDLKHKVNIKILDDLMDYGHCNIRNNLDNECIAINKDTKKDFLDYAIVLKNTYAIDAY